jgi:hypothetical protein
MCLPRNKGPATSGRRTGSLVLRSQLDLIIGTAKCGVAPISESAVRTIAREAGGCIEMTTRRAFVMRVGGLSDADDRLWVTTYS